MAKKIAIGTIIIIIILAIWIIWGNSALELNEHEVSSSNLPKSFEGFRIAQVSDLHNAKIGKGNIELINTIKNAEPDVIAITGDMIDSRRTDVQVALEFAKEAVKIAPCYYVNGNHELRADEYQDLKEGLLEAGVKVLENEKLEIVKGADKVSIIGLSDPSFESNALDIAEDEIIDTYLRKLVYGDENYKILLSHRPEMFESYEEAGVDLALSGHAHGGQIRLPVLGGIIAPHQGIFPKYDSGVYIKEETCMVVSRGIGNSLFPFRVNNRPEVVLIELQAR